MDSLIELMNGSPDFGDKVYNSSFDKGESCGCTMGAEGIKIQKEARKRVFQMPVERTIFDWHLIEIDDAVARVKTADDIHDVFSSLWENNHLYTGEEFYICVDENYIESLQKDVNTKTVGYSEKLDVIYGMKDGISVPRQLVSLDDMVPNYDPESEETSMYLFVPLHAGAECLGYYVSKNHYKIIKDFYLNSLIRHMTSALERARQNIKLENLNKILADISVRDELTGLYNRMGYEKIVIPYLDELRHSGMKSVIMVADINRMKVINDKYGHLQGDTAIKIVANVIKSSIPQNWKAVRYGGDEYVIIGKYDSSKDMESVKIEITEKSGRVSEDLNLPFRLSVSVGYVVIDPENKLGNEEYFRMADEAMYEMKQEAHKNDRT
jgi:diguanylate cyclase (GGDEF)-like protein